MKKGDWDAMGSRAEHPDFSLIMAEGSQGGS